MSFCAKCGGQLNEGAAFCGKCGAASGPRMALVASVPAPAETSAAIGAPAEISNAATNSGITSNMAGALSYLFGLLTGIIFLVLDPYKKDPFVKFHALQSVFFNVAWVGFWIVWTTGVMVFEAITGGFLAVMIIPVDCLLVLGGMGYWGFLMYTAYSGRQHTIPILGRLARRQVGA